MPPVLQIIKNIKLKSYESNIIYSYFPNIIISILQIPIPVQLILYQILSSTITTISDTNASIYLSGIF